MQVDSADLLWEQPAAALTLMHTRPYKKESAEHRNGLAVSGSSLKCGHCAAH